LDQEPQRVLQCQRLRLLRHASEMAAGGCMLLQDGMQAGQVCLKRLQCWTRLSCYRRCIAFGDGRGRQNHLPNYSMLPRPARLLELRVAHVEG
jgi:hypothetical protein